jgi:glucose/mannose-6-phosphate isomerase
VGTLPELDHNEIEGWSPTRGAGFAAVVLRPGHEPGWIGRRVTATLAAVEGSGLDAREVRAGEGPPMARLFRLIALGDFVSTYLAVLRGVDPTPIPVLTKLKRELRS